MSTTGELTEYLELQRSAEFVTKTELIEALRESGLSISSRNLTYYSSVGLIPAAIRIGGRAGAYPQVVVEQLAWVIKARDRDQSIDSIKELLPLWRWLMRSRLQGSVDLAELELVARQHCASQEANFAVPYLISEVLLGLCGECLGAIEWTLKDGSVVRHSSDSPVTLSFILGAVNEDTGRAEVMAWTQLSLPGIGHPGVDDPASITLGLPVGVFFDSQVEPGQSSSQRCGPRRSSPTHQEALPLA